ncbi:MAG: hypothetical protein HYZ42_03525, partial [Bacteroidetes bacterium]|nr:hypothetical protein [Bacteroidota bacterium]
MKKLILLFSTYCVLCTLQLSAQIYNDDYFEVFYENNINNDKTILFQKYLVLNQSFDDSLAQAQHIKSMNIEEINTKWKYTYRNQKIYDQKGRCTFSLHLYDYKNRFENRSYMYQSQYSDDTAKYDDTYYYSVDGKLRYVSTYKTISDTLKIYLTKDRNFIPKE